jgi:hypothetical protein
MVGEKIRRCWQISCQAKIKNMNIDQIREQIAISLSSLNIHTHEKWLGILDDTTPGHYGVEVLKFELAKTDIWVDIPKKIFTFKNGTLSFSARLGSSREEDAVDMPFDKVVSGSGTLDFGSAEGVKVLDFKINEKIDLL